MTMKLAALALCAVLAGCAHQQYDTSHMSEAERAAAIGAILSRPQPQPYYIDPNIMRQQPSYQAPAYQPPQQRFCQSQLIGNMRHTQCF